MSTTTDTQAPSEGGQETHSLPPAAEEKAAQQQAPEDLEVALFAAAKRAEELRSAAKEARDAAELLTKAAKEASEEGPSLLTTVAHGALFAAAGLLTGFLIEGVLNAFRQPEVPQRHLHRREDDEDAQPLPTRPTSPHPVGAQ